MATRHMRDDPAYVVGSVSVAHFLSHVFLLAFPPLFPLLGREFGLSTTRLGLLVTAIYVPTLLLQLPLGDVVDRVGAKRVLVSGLAVTATGITLAGFAWSYPALLACAFLSGIGQSVFHPADYALLDTATGPSGEGTAFGVHTFGGFAGFAAAPVAVGGVGVWLGWGAALVAAGLIGFAYAAVFHVTVAPIHVRAVAADEAAEPAGASIRETFRGLVGFARRFDLLLVSSFYLLSMMAVVGLQSFTTVLAVDTFGFGESAANTLLSVHLGATAVGVIAGGPLADRLPFREIIAAMFLSAALGVWALVALGPSQLAVGLLLSLVGLLIGLALPSRDKLGNAVADAGTAGKSFGLYFTGLSVGAVVSPVLLGAVIDAWSPGAAFLLVGGFLVCAVGVVAVAGLAGVAQPGTEAVQADD